jgi:hypothetical protein
VMLGDDGASQGVASIEVDGVGTQLCDDDEGLLRDLVRRGVSFDVLGSAAPGDAAPTLGSIGTTSPRVSGLPLSGSPSFSPLPID